MKFHYKNSAVAFLPMLPARKLKRMGFSKVYDMKGGYQNWNPVN